ncbi:hypothetical protein JNUCC0626_18990 [Lentzea sp. JNUCC 0626]|uniref:hypothetical protein n=1 Tax=Lentzea sp. JNUCC 0626 TaxID=3367513 RepID=UPI003748371F
MHQEAARSFVRPKTAGAADTPRSAASAPTSAVAALLHPPSSRAAAADTYSANEEVEL